MTERLSFKFTQSKHVEPIELNKITILSNSKILDYNDVSTDPRLDRIDNYYKNLEQIIFSKKGFKFDSGKFGRSKLKLDEIKAIYLDINNGEKIKSSMGKNELIDEIDKFFREVYVPRKHVDVSKIEIKDEEIPFINNDDEDD